MQTMEEHHGTPWSWAAGPRRYMCMRQSMWLQQRTHPWCPPWCPCRDMPPMLLPRPCSRSLCRRSIARQQSRHAVAVLLFSKHTSQAADAHTAHHVKLAHATSVWKCDICRIPFSRARCPPPPHFTGAPQGFSEAEARIESSGEGRCEYGGYHQHTYAFSARLHLHRRPP